MRKKYVLKNKKRFSAFVVMILIFLFSSVSITTAYGFKTPKYDVITVNSGDTLWSIAQKCIKKGDIRQNIYKIQTENNLLDTNIHQGMQLKVPVDY